MLGIIALAAAVALLLSASFIGRRRIGGASLGWMSEEWVHEYRASHP